MTRIRGEQTNSFLDQLEVYVILEFCERLSRDLTARKSPRLSGGSPKRYAFQVASAGCEAVAETVSHLVQFTGSARAVPAMYSWFSANRHKAEVRPLLDSFRDGVARQLPLGPGNALMGPVVKRYLHTSESAAAEYSMHKRRVLELVTNAGLLGPKARRNFRTPFDAAKAYDFLVGATQVSSVHEIANVLGTTVQRAEKLVEAGLIGSISGERRRRLVSASDAERLLSSLRSAAIRATTEDGLISLHKAEKKHRMDIAFLVRSAIQGKLGDISWMSETCDLSTIRLDENQLEFRLTQILGQAYDLSFAAATRRLSIDEEAVKYLSKKRHLRVAPRVSNRGLTMSDCITLNSVKAFEDTYISISDVARLVSLRVPKLRRMLEQANIRPAIESESHGLTFYARSDVQDHFLAQLR